MEPISISFLLSTFVALVDRIKNLEKIKFQDKQTLFNEIVKPLFEALEPVVLNYMDFFRKARQIVNKNPRKNISKVVQSIREDRDAMVMARIKVRETANQIKEQIKDEEITEFAMAVNGFFYQASDPPPMLDSLAVNFMHSIENAAHQNVEDRELVGDFNEVIDDILKGLELSWSLIVKSYEKIKIDSVSPSKYVQKRSTKKPKPR